MSFPRMLLADLVDKRLWPLALILLLAAIAIPVAVGASGATAPAAAPPAQPAPQLTPGLPDPGRAIASVAGTGTPPQEAFNNYEHNPFRKPYGPRTSAAAVSRAAKAPAAKGTGPTGSSGTGTAKGKTKTSTTTPKASPKTTPPPTPTKKIARPLFGPNDSYAVDLTLAGSGSGSTQTTTGAATTKDLVRLAPLPPGAPPVAIFLGVLQGGGSSAFLFTQPVRFFGQFKGRCLPSTTACAIVELKSGETVGLLTAGAADTTKPQLTLTPKIRIETHSSHAAALRVRRLRSEAGRLLLAQADAAARDALSYSAATGSLMETAPVSVKSF